MSVSKFVVVPPPLGPQFPELIYIDVSEGICTIHVGEEGTVAMGTMTSNFPPMCTQGGLQ